MEKVTKPLFTHNGNEGLFLQLRQDVYAVVEQLEPKRKGQIVGKAIIFPALYIAIYLLALMAGSNPLIFYACYFSLGILLVFIFLNIIHDAVHRTIFKSRSLNDAYVYFFDLMGANSYIWKLRHIRFHHNYPNVNGWDTDIEQSDMVRIFPDAPYLKAHRYQHIYMPLLYPFYLLNWLLVRDFKDFFNKKKTVWKLAGIPRVEYVKLFIFKTFFLFYILVLPILVLPVSPWVIVGAFLIMMFTASVFSLAVLLSPHANVESEFPLPDEENRLPYNWMMHMLRTTNDVTNDNWFTRFCMGCFNYHVVHHLFPNVNHAFYPEITGVLKDYARAHDLPYRRLSLWGSLRSHYLLLKTNRMPENIFEETM